MMKLVMSLVVFLVFLVAILLFTAPQALAEKDGLDGKPEWPSAEEKKLIDEAKKRMKTTSGKAVDMKNKKVKVFIFLGQSNMVGQTPAKQLPSKLRRTSSKVLRLEDEGWIKQKPHDTNNGPEIPFAYYCRKKYSKEYIGIIKVAVGGTGIRGFLPEWKKEVADITGDGKKGPLYWVLKEAIIRVKELCDPEFEAVFWKQGGKDMKSASAASGYAENLGKIIKEIRKDTEVDDLPFFIGTYADEEDLKKKKVRMMAQMMRPNALDVLEAYVKAAKDNEHAELVNHGMLSTLPDGIHFDTKGQIELGKLFFEAYRDKRKEMEKAEKEKK